MSYDHWKTTEPDRDEPCRIVPIDPPECADCGTHDDVRHSQPVNGGREFCEPCYRWRSRHQVEFDPRSRAEIASVLLDQALVRG